MEQTKQFIKLPKKAKAILTTFKDANNLNVLFASILENIGTQKTLKSIHVRRSEFRGILRIHFNMSDDDMKPIESTADQKQAYFDSNLKGFKKQKENTVSETLIKSIMNTSPICKLLIQSGLRVGELLENQFKVVNFVPHFKLNKKLDSAFYPVHILGDTKEWIKSYRELRRGLKGKDISRIINYTNRALKNVIPADFYKQSTHICRAIYVAYLNRFKDKNLTQPQIIHKYLNHEHPSTSIHYNYIDLDKGVTNFLNA